MAADPGSSGDEGAPYHLFLTRIPPKLPKEEVEAAISAQLASRRVGVLAISVVPQSAWKNKGFGFVILAGSPSSSEVGAIAADLDNNIRVGGKGINVRVCEASSSGSKPPLSSGTLTTWDQPVDKITRLCAQVLHCYFARRAHQEAYKAEKLIALLSMSVAPSCCQQSKPVALWGRDIYGSLEKMLLAIGESYFGGGWSLQGTIADRNAVLSIGKARHIQGWDSLREPLPIATLLRLAASKQRLESLRTREASSGFSSPTLCRRCSDCGSLSAMNSTEQPSCSQSEASWSLRSLYTVPATAAESTGSHCSPSLCTPTNDTEATTLSFVISRSPVSSGPCNSAESCSRDPEFASQTQASQQNMLGDGDNAASPSCDQPMAGSQAYSRGLQVEVSSSCNSLPAGSIVSMNTGIAECGRGPSPLSQCPGAPSTVRQRNRTSRSTRRTLGSCPSPAGQPSLSPGRLRRRPRPVLSPPPPQQQSPHQLNLSTRGVVHKPGRLPMHTAAASQQEVVHLSHPPSARDLLDQCAQRIISLIHRQPAQVSYAVDDLASYLSGAQEVLACCHDTPYFSLEGYASAVYGSFENFLSEISRHHLHNSWRIGDGRMPGEPRILYWTRRSAAPGGVMPIDARGW